MSSFNKWSKLKSDRFGGSLAHKAPEAHNHLHKDYNKVHDDYTQPKDYYPPKDYSKVHDDYIYPNDYYPPRVKDYQPYENYYNSYPPEYSSYNALPAVRARPFDISFEDWLDSSGVEAFGLPSDEVSYYQDPPPSEYQHVGQRQVVPNPGYDKPLYSTATQPYDKPLYRDATQPYDKPLYSTATQPYDAYKTTEKPYYGTFKATESPYRAPQYGQYQYSAPMYRESPYSAQYTERPYTAPVYIPKYEDTVYSSPARYQESYPKPYLYSKQNQQVKECVKKLNS